MKIIAPTIIFLFVFVSLSFARPPVEIRINYQVSEQLLFVEVEHPTHDLNDDFIKRITVTKGEGEPQIFNFPHQPDSKKQVLKITLQAEPFEKIKVTAQCKEGGIKESEFIVPSEDQVKP